MLIEATNPTDHRLRQNLEPTNLANFTNPANLANLTNPCNSTNLDNLPNHPNLTDKELYATCKKWGAQALHSRRKFAGYLPEVNKREMSARVKGKSWFERRGYKNIYNFAARLAGMSKDQVNTVLRLSQRFTNMPILREALTEGKISHHKLLRIAAIATIENQTELMEKALVLSKAALDIFVRDYKKEHFTPGHEETFCDDKVNLPNLFDEKFDGSLMPKIGNNCLPGQTKNAESPLEQANLKSVSENEENPNN